MFSANESEGKKEDAGGGGGGRTASAAAKLGSWAIRILTISTDRRGDDVLAGWNIIRRNG